ncbi:hypothetical protein L0F51_08580 [Afifella sp. H1R]|uniref:hypothetical protein n=1 Tax=Afifella sp. H1R TaxID=2908841 RepID=UPI001F2021AE|nr:hypothetical protein [Afifella sp. H1R]MCF1503814.1 hypothetical protein [Afifella sp. H1R]
MSDPILHALQVTEQGGSIEAGTWGDRQGLDLRHRLTMAITSGGCRFSFACRMFRSAACMRIVRNMFIGTTFRLIAGVVTALALVSTGGTPIGLRRGAILDMYVPRCMVAAAHRRLLKSLIPIAALGCVIVRSGDRMSPFIRRRSM